MMAATPQVAAFFLGGTRPGGVLAENLCLITVHWNMLARK